MRRRWIGALIDTETGNYEIWIGRLLLYYKRTFSYGRGTYGWKVIWIDKRA